MLVAHWVFCGGHRGSNPLKDACRNFPDMILEGPAGNKALITPDGLAVGSAPSGTSPETTTRWAISGPASGYRGPTLTNKTLVSWLMLQGLPSAATAGSAITIQNSDGTIFDGVVFSEKETDRWSEGSENFLRYQPFMPGYRETTTGSLVQIAITYAETGPGNVQITGYRNGVSIGQYTTGNARSFTTAQVVLGARQQIHQPALPPIGNLWAFISEIRIYDEALTAADIAGL